MTQPVLEQTAFRMRGDHGALDSIVWNRELNADWTQALDRNFRVRFVIAETGGGMANNIAYGLQYSLNGGTFTFIGSSEAVLPSLSSQFANGDATTQLLSAGSFVAGVGVEDTATTNISLASQVTEIEWCLQLNSALVSPGDTVNMRVVQSDGTVLDNYAAPL